MTSNERNMPWETPGSIFDGKYRIISQLGTGAFGGVYLAEHILMQKKVAIKLLHDNHSENSEAVHRFQREAQAAGNIDHPNICSATDYGQYQDSYYIVMEYLDGRSLFEVESEVGRFDVLRALHVVIQVASALEKAHEIGIVHRDLKPENIVLIEHEGDHDFVKITDFGIAQIEAKSGDIRLTQAGMVYGSPLYLSPEQARAETIDHRSDLYSVGVILYELLLAQLPFMGESATAVLAKHVTEPPPLFADVAPELESDAGVEAIIQKLLKKNPAERYQSATELREALEAAQTRIQRHGIQNKTNLRNRLSKRYQTIGDSKRVYIAGAIILIILVSLTIYFLASSDKPDKDLSVEEVEAQVAETQRIKEEEESEEDSSPRVDIEPIIQNRKEFLQRPEVAAAISLYDTDKDAGILAMKNLLEQNVSKNQLDREGGGEEGNTKGLDDDWRNSTDSALKDGMAENDLMEGTGANNRMEDDALVASAKPSYDKMGLAHLHFLLAERLSEQKKSDEVFSHLEKAVANQPNYSYDPEFLKILFARLQSGSAKESELASAFIKKYINRPIGRRLAELAEHDKLRSIRKTTLGLLEDTGYFKKLPKWNRLTIRLRHAQGCEDNKQYIIKIGELRDSRALGALRRFTAHPTTGCGVNKQEDCWGCLRPDLRTAVDRLEGRE